MKGRKRKEGREGVKGGKGEREGGEEEEEEEEVKSESDVDEQTAEIPVSCRCNSRGIIIYAFGFHRLWCQWQNFRK